MWPLEMADPEKGRGMLLTQVGFGQENALAEFDSGYSSKSLLVAPMPPRVLSKKTKQSILKYPKYQVKQATLQSKLHSIKTELFRSVLF